MTEQATLFDNPPALLLGPHQGLTIKENFDLFHKANPEVLRMIVRIARWLKFEKGFEHGGMKMIFERMRWLHAVKTRGEVYKLNNNYTSHYARLVMDECPDLDGFFRTRGE